MMIALILLMQLATAQPPAKYDPDRLNTAAMERLVASPIAKLRAGRIDDAVASLEAMRNNVLGDDANSALARADLDEAFGVLAFTAKQDEDGSSLAAVALPHLERAVPSYRTAFGRLHPEVALALQSWADVLIAANRVGNADAARSAYCEAYHIRLVSLGPGHEGTGSALAQVLKLAPQETLDPALLARLTAEPKPDFSDLPKNASPLEYLPRIRSAIEAARAEREAAYRTLATDPRFRTFCPEPVASGAE